VHDTLVLAIGYDLLMSRPQKTKGDELFRGIRANNNALKAKASYHYAVGCDL